MTQDEIIEMARQARCEPMKLKSMLGGPVTYPTDDAIERFAKLVAAKERDRMCEQCNWSKHENATCHEANQPKILGES